MKSLDTEKLDKSWQIFSEGDLSVNVGPVDSDNKVILFGIGIFEK